MNNAMKGFATLFLLLTLLIISSCGTDNSASEVDSTTIENTDEIVEISLGTTGPSGGDHPFPVAAEKFQESLDEISGGAFDVTIFPEGQLGAEREMLEAVKGNNLDMTIVTITGAAPAWVPEGQVFSLPYLINDFEHAYRVLDGEVGDYLTEKLKEEGWINLNYLQLGARHLTNSVRPLEEPADVEGLRIRVQESPIWFHFIESLGGSPTPMVIEELYSSLSQGVVDGQENPVTSILANSLYEVQDYLTLDAHEYAFAYFIIGEEKWESLSEEQQDWVQQAADETVKFNRDWVNEKEELVLKELEELGMKINEPDMEKFREATKEIPDEVTDIVPSELVDLVRESAE